MAWAMVFLVLSMVIGPENALRPPVVPMAVTRAWSEMAIPRLPFMAMPAGFSTVTVADPVI